MTFIKKDRKLLGVLAHTAGAFLTECLRHSCGHQEATPGIVAVIQTAGDSLRFNPHIHILSTEGCLVDDAKNHYHVAGFMDYDIVDADFVERSAYRRNWRRLIWKIFGADPLLCPRCGAKPLSSKLYCFGSTTSDYQKKKEKNLSTQSSLRKHTMSS